MAALRLLYRLAEIPPGPAERSPRCSSTRIPLCDSARMAAYGCCTVTLATRGRAPALQLPSAWRLRAAAGFLWVFVGVESLNILKASRSERTRAYIRAHMTQPQPLLPSTTEERVGFLGLSVTAGLCEEFLFRGYLIWVLAPYLGWWGAAAFSRLSFGVVHAYQGRKRGDPGDSLRCIVDANRCRHRFAGARDDIPRCP